MVGRLRTWGRLYKTDYRLPEKTSSESG